MDKKHYFLACCEVAFHDSEGNTGITRVNSMVENDSQNLTVKNIGRIQQGAQITLHKQLGQVVEVAMVVIIGWSYMGYMTAEEVMDGHVPDNDNDETVN